MGRPSPTANALQGRNHVKDTPERWRLAFIPDPSGSGQLDGLPGGDVDRQFVQRLRGKADTKRSEGIAENLLNLGNGPTLVGARERAQDGCRVAPTLLFHLLSCRTAATGMEESALCSRADRRRNCHNQVELLSAGAERVFAS